MLYLIADGSMQIDSAGRFWKGSKRAEHKTPQGYLQIRRMVQGHRYHTNAHRVVYMYFKGPIPEGYIIHHRNGQKDDNRPENLELSTYSRNQHLAHKAGLIDQYGQKNPQAKLSDKQVAEIRLAYAGGGYTQKDLADKYGVTFQHISVVVRGDSRQKQGGTIGDYSHRRTEGNRPRSAKTGRFEKR